MPGRDPCGATRRSARGSDGPLAVERSQSRQGRASRRQPPRYPTVMRAGPASRLAEAVRAVAAASRGTRRRTVVGSSGRRRDPLAARIDITAAGRGGCLRRVKGEELLGQITGHAIRGNARSEEHTSELQSRLHLVCRLLLEKKKKYASPI